VPVIIVRLRLFPLRSAVHRTNGVLRVSTECWVSCFTDVLGHRSA